MVERGMSLSTRTLSFHWNGVMKSTYVVFLTYHIKSASLYLLQSTNMVLISWEPNWWIYRLLCTWFGKGEIMCSQWSPFSLGLSTVFFVSPTLNMMHWSRIWLKKNLYTKTLIEEWPNSLREQSTQQPITILVTSQAW